MSEPTGGPAERLAATLAILALATIVGGSVFALSGSTWAAGATVAAVVGGTWATLRFGELPERD